MAFKYIENKDIQRDFKNGISEVEVLPGNFKGHHHYKLNLQAGATYTPAEKYSDKTVIYIFGMGKGYVCTPENSYNINELSSLLIWTAVTTPSMPSLTWISCVWLLT